MSGVGSVRRRMWACAIPWNEELVDIVWRLKRSAQVDVARGMVDESVQMEMVRSCCLKSYENGPY